jgi:hypothetical protein
LWVLVQGLPADAVVWQDTPPVGLVEPEPLPERKRAETPDEIRDFFEKRLK